MYDEVDAYHPRYASTEWLTYEARERARRRRAIFFGTLGLLCFAGIIYLLG
jgi:hypothetical protein